MVSLETEDCIGLVTFHDAVNDSIAFLVIQRVQEAVTGMERVVLGDMAFLGTLANGQPQHHAVDVLQVGVHVLLGTVEYGLGGIAEGPVTPLAVKSLPSITGAVALDIGTTAMDTAYLAVLEAVVLQKLLNGINAQDLG